tara:strand:+ start:20 stop:1345 length:1326 start_codon:yes stop_codon:yes gene_type:complete
MANSYLNRTQGSATNQKKGTFSFWIKRSKLGSNQRIVTNYNDVNNLSYLRFNSSDQLQHYVLSGGSAIGSIVSTRVFRDTSAWYHIVMAIDTTQATAADRIKFYVNGVQETSFGTNTIPSQDADHPIFAAGTHYIGRHSNAADYFDGYISHAAQVDGTALTPTSFGLTDSTSGIWKFKSPSGITWGNNGFHLKFENSGAMGTDSSGNSNTFTVNGNLKQALDTPSNVHATWNPIWSQSSGNIGDVVFSNGNLTTTSSANYRTTPTTLGMKTGKYYWEIKRDEDDGADLHAGVMSENATPANTATWIGNAANGWIISGDGGNPYTGGTGGSAISNASFPNAGDIHMCAYDGSTGKLYFGANGTWGGTANPSTGANPHYTLDTSLVYFPCVSTGSDCSANFGNGFFGTTAITSAGSNGNGSLFEYDVPSGFYALNTKNINTYG